MGKIATLRLAVALLAASPPPLTGVAPEAVTPLAKRWVAGFEHGAGAALARPSGPPQGRLFPAFDRFLRGDGAWALLTREIAEADLATYRAAHHGGAPLIVAVAGGSPDRFGLVDPVVAIVHPDNPLSTITLRQLDALLSTTRWRGGAPVARWGDLGVAAWRDRPVHVVGGEAWAGEESARALTIRRHVLSLPGKAGRWRRFADSGSEADVVARVAMDPDAIGFTGLGHVTPGVRILAIDGVFPSRPAVAGGRYPLARTVDLLLPRSTKGCIDRRAGRFAVYLLSSAGQAVIRAQGDFLPLTPAQRRSSRVSLARHCRI